MNTYLRLLAGAVIVSLALAGCETEPAPSEEGLGGEEELGIEEGYGEEEGYPEEEYTGEEEERWEEEPEEGAAEEELVFEGLSPADQALARAQKVCPVSGELLGEMGTPVKVTAGDKTVFLCCEECQPDFEKDPEKYIAKLRD